MEKYTPKEALVEAQILEEKIAEGVATSYKEAEKSLTPEAKAAEYKVKFDQIMSRALTPENINTYAEDAVNELIQLTDMMLDEYSKSVGEGIEKRYLEDAALKHNNLTGINEALDYISRKEIEIKKLDVILAKSAKKNGVILPPDLLKSPIVEGNGSYREKLIIARTKTVLFILSNDFGIDVNRPEDTKITTGALTDRMMRKISYTILEIPKLNRIVFCCDEEGNATYVINSELLGKNQILPSKLADMSKEELKALFDQDPELGKRLIYSKHFVSNIISLLKEIKPMHEKNAEVKSGQYLYPLPPKGYLSEFGLAKKLGISTTPIRPIIKELGEKLGEVKKYKFGPLGHRGYSPQQQSLIIERLEEKGIFEEAAPEGHLTVMGMAEKFGLSYWPVQKTVEEIGEKLGETKKYHFGPRIAVGYSLQQQEQINCSF